MLRDLTGHGLAVEHRRLADIGDGASHGVAVAITAGPVGRDELRVEKSYCRFEILLADPVKLNALPGGNPQGPIGVLLGDAIEDLPLLRAQLSSSRILRPDHEGVLSILPLRAQTGSEVPVILLIGAVEFQ